MGDLTVSQHRRSWPLLLRKFAIDKLDLAPADRLALAERFRYGEIASMAGVSGMGKMWYAIASSVLVLLHVWRFEWLGHYSL